MQSKIILSQILSKITELKQQITDFESSETPSQQQADELHHILNHTNKLVSAYSILLNHKSVSPQVDIHIKVMEAAEKNHTDSKVFDAQSVPKIEDLTAAQTPEAEPVISHVSSQNPMEAKISDDSKTPLVEEKKEVIVAKEYPKLSININDKFRFISELFKTNANEYNIAIEQLNACQSWNEAQVYLSNLQSIYQWDLDSEMVKRLYQSTQKRFS